MEIDKPRFSVVIPCFNEELYIADTLESIFSQETLAQYEVIVVDNNCSDQTTEIVKSYNVKLVHESIPGIAAARQKGTEIARGEIIVSTDGDTRFKPDWLDKIDRTFKHSPELVAVGGPCKYYDGPWWGNFYTHFLFGWSYIYSKITGHPSYITATNFAFKKSAWSGYNLIADQGCDELGLLHQLKHHGKIAFKYDNPIFTSGRRLKRGLLYNVFVTFLYYYLAGYYINSKFKRHIISAAPAIREDRSYVIRYNWATTFIIIIIAFSSLGFVRPVRTFISDNKADVVGLFRRLL